MSAGAAERARPAPADTDAAAEPRRPLRLAVVGVSNRSVCGVRDHTQHLAQALEAAGMQCSTHWLACEAAGLRATRAQVAAWGRALPGELERSGAEAVLFQYSVFSYSYRGVPIFLFPVLSALRRSGLPIITLAHEFAYPWRRDGLRGTVWALTQRAGLLAVVHRSAALMLTTDSRARWLSSRRWLPRRPTAVAPVFSNLPAPHTGTRAGRAPATVGIFGYSYGRETAGAILDAMQLLERSGTELRLTLLGAPGPASGEGEMWIDEARARGLAGAIDFTGLMPSQELAGALASCEVLLFADPGGPSSRKTTLAAALGSGRPVVALDGPHRWGELLDANAVRAVARRPGALADALRALMDDARSREALGGRGRQFAERHMTVGRSVEALNALLDGLPAR